MYLRALWPRVENDLIDPLTSDIIIAINNNYCIGIILFRSRGHRGANNRLQHIICDVYVYGLYVDCYVYSSPETIIVYYIIIIRCRI